MSANKEITVAFVLASYEEYGDDLLIIDITNSNQSKDGAAKYYKNYVKTPKNSFAGSSAFTEEKYLAFLKYGPTVIYGCKSPEIRAKRKNAPASFSVTTKSVDKQGNQVGRACEILHNAWVKQLKTMISSDKLEMAKTHQFIQYKTSSGQTIDNPIVRVVLRPKNRTDNTINREVKIVDPRAPNGFRTTSADGRILTLDNIHEDVKGGSIAMGVIDFASTSHTQQGYANQHSNNGMIIKPSNGNGSNLSDVFNRDEMAELMGAETTQDPDIGYEEYTETPTNQLNTADPDMLMSMANAD